MVHRLRIAGLAIGLLAITALPAAAHTLNVTVTATCACKYSVTASGNTDANTAVGIDLSFLMTISGVDYLQTKHIDTNSDGSGNFAVTVDDNQLIPGGCTGAVRFSGFSDGEASLTFNGITEKGFNADLPAMLSCNTVSSGKTFDIGPSSMEGHLLIRPGDWISGGYSFKFASSSHDLATVTVASKLTIPFRCADGTTGQFVINLGTRDHTVPAGNTAWQPTGDANSVLSWAGSGKAPAGCGPGNVMDNSQGAVFEATVQQDPDNGALLNWRFKYRDPNAKGKGNVNCLDTSDPRRAKADVCGASWSETVKDP